MHIWFLFFSLHVLLLVFYVQQSMDHSETEFEKNLIKIKKFIFVDLLTFDCATTQGGATASFSSVASRTATQAYRVKAMCLRSGLFYNLIQIDFL